MTFQLSSIREGGFTKTFFVVPCLHVSPCVKAFSDYVKKEKNFDPSATVLTEKGFEVSSRFLQGHNHRAPFSEAQKTSRNPYTKYSLLYWKRKQNASGVKVRG